MINGCNRLSDALLDYSGNQIPTVILFLKYLFLSLVSDSSLSSSRVDPEAQRRQRREEGSHQIGFVKVELRKEQAQRQVPFEIF